jgi:hypothetical protein
MHHLSTPRPATVRHQRSNSLRRLRIASAAGLATLLLACASQPPPPTTHMAAAEAAVDSAVRAGAQTAAPAEMALARDKLARAHASMVETKYERAQMLAEAALVDARLAEARARQALAAKAATTVQDDNRVLSQEIERGVAQ